MKKRILFLSLIIVLLVSVMTTMSVISINTDTQKVALADVWDGSTATYFAGGSGIDGDPYEIANAEQLSLLANIINVGVDAVVIDSDPQVLVDYATLQTAYYELTANIELNDETFTFDADTGLVIMTDGPNTAFIGTGIKGAAGGLDAFDDIASVRGAIYTDMAGTTGTYSGVVNPWFAIGNNTNKFNGKFNGADHTVSGIYINTTNEFQGLFGYADSESSINNIGVINSFAKGDYFVSGIVGNNIGTISNSYNIGTVTGTNFYVGGVAGSSEGTIINSYNEGVVIGFEYVGGVVGYNNMGTVSNSYNTGNVTGAHSSVGGVVGRNWDGTIKNSYNAGTVSGASNYVGGVAGHSSGTVADCYYLAGSAKDGNDVVQYGVGIGSLGSNNPDTGTIRSFDTTATLISSVTAGAYTGTNLLLALNGWVAAQATPNDYMWWTDEIYPVFDLTVYFAGGTGIDGDPYQIANAEQLYLLANIINAGGAAIVIGGETSVDYEILQTAYYELTAKIELNDENFTFDPDTGLVIMTDGTNIAYLGTGINGESGGIDTFDGTASTMGAIYPNNTSTATGSYSGVINSWIPIGTNSHPFAGNFNGAGFTISGLYINNALNNQGLFGHIASFAKVENTGIIESYIKGYSVVGAIAGLSISSIIDNCYNEGFVLGTYMFIAGIVGKNDSNSITKNCYNSGKVIGLSGHVGGITSFNKDSTIQNCYNTGSIRGFLNSVGGIVSGTDNSTILDCYNTGTVMGGGSVGGICGTNSSPSIIENCYNTGLIDASGARIGGIVGFNSGATLRNSYNIGTVRGLAYYIGGVVGYNTGTVEYSYYLSGCAYLTFDGTLQNGIGHGTPGELTVDLPGVTTPFNTGATFSSDVSVGSYTGTSLLSALNAWVDSQTPDDYSSWVVRAGENDGFPMFKIGILTTFTIYYNGANLLEDATVALKDGIVSFSLDYEGGEYNGIVSDSGSYDLFVNGANTGIVLTVDTDNYNFTVYLFTVSYDNNGASGTVPATAYYGEGITINIPGNSGGLAKTGYAFAGFGLVADGVEVKTNVTVGTEPITLYAIFMLNAPVVEITDNALPFIYGDTLSATYTHALKDELGASATYEWKVGETIVGNQSTYKPDASATSYEISCKVTFSIDGNESSQTATKSYTVNMAVLTVTASSHTVTYGDAAPSYTVSYDGFVNGEDETYLDTLPTATSLYTVTTGVNESGIATEASGGADGNYSFDYIDGAITISQATNNWTTPLAITGWTYGESANAPTAVATFGTAAFTYSDSEEGTYTAIVPTNVGTWWVKATVVETDDYTGLESVASFIISKAQLTEPNVTGTYTYTGLEQTVTYSGYNDTTMSVAGDLAATNAGDYTLTFTIDDTANYEWAAGSDGSVNWTIDPIYFAGGTGVDGAPYLISNPSQLYLLANIINAGSSAVVIESQGSVLYEYLQQAYYKLTYDIVLNNETFTFDPDTALVIMTDETNIAYIGTGIRGASGGNSVFDSGNPVSVAGSIYTSIAQGGFGSYSGIVNPWFAIGYSSTRSFNGKFDGDGHTVAGIYINNTDANQGLFGYTNTAARISNVGIINSYIKGGSYVGGIVGRGQGTTIENSNNSAIITGSGHIGGIAGEIITSGTIENCYNMGSVLSVGSYGGGIVARVSGSTIENCYNMGSFAANNVVYIGGIAGIVIDSEINNCYNTGNVKALNYVGGIVGTSSSSIISNSYNTGNVSGYYFIGGIVGDMASSSTLSNCYNTGNVIANTTHTGGIVGNLASGTISNSYYLSGCAIAGSTPQNGVGHATSGSTTEDIIGRTTPFDVSSLFESDVSVGSYTGTSLLSALNAWIDDQTIPQNYYSWKTESGVNNNYPIYLENAINSWTTALSITGWTYNESANSPTASAEFGTPKFTYSDSEEGVYTSTVPTNAGTWWVKANVSVTASYAEIESVVSFVIAKAQLTEPTVTGTYTYTGLELTVTYTGYYDTTMTVGGDEAGIIVNSYTLTFTINDTTNYEWAAGSDGNVEWSISQATNSWTTSLSIAGWTYGEVANSPTAAATFGTAVFTYSDTELGIYTSTVPINAGTWWVKASVAGTTNYTGLESVASFTILKAQLTEPSATGTYTYTGLEQTVTYTGYNDTTMTVGGDTVGTNAGGYTLTFTIDDTANYEWATGNGNLAWEILQATNNWTTPLSITGWTYGGSANAPTAVATFGTVVFTYSDSELGVYTSTVPTNAGTWYVKATVAGTTNYTGLESVASFTISKAQLTEPSATGTYTYTGLEQTVTYTGYNDTTMTVGGDTVGTNAGEYNLSFTIFDTTNYEWVTGNGSVAWEILQATNSWTTSLLIADWTYGGSANAPTAVATFGTSVFTYSDSEAGTFTATVPTDLGTWWVKASVLGTTNYTGLESVASFAILKAQLTEPTITGTYIYTGVEVTVAYSGYDNTTMSVAGDETGTTAGEYSLSFIILDTANYEWATGNGSVAWEILQATNSWTTSLLIADWTYGESANAPTAVATFGTPEFTYSDSEEGTYTATVPTNAGTWWLKANVAETMDYTGIESVTSFVIEKAKLAEPTVTGTYIYTGDEQTATLNGFDVLTMSIVSGNTATNVGNYTIIILIIDTANYEWLTGSDGSISWTIGKIQLTEPAITGTYTYSGDEQTATLAGFDALTMSIDTSITATNAGSYTIVVLLIDASIYEWAAGSDGFISWNISKMLLTEPTISGTYEYTGAQQTATLVGFNNTAMSIVSGNTATNAGSYTVVIIIQDTDNYEWASGSDGQIIWTIGKATNNWIVEPVITEWTYGEEPKNPEAEAAFGEVIITYSDSENGTYRDIVPTTEGTWWIKAVVEETGNYTGFESVSSFSILASSDVADTPDRVYSWMDTAVWSFVLAFMVIFSLLVVILSNRERNRKNEGQE